MGAVRRRRVVTRWQTVGVFTIKVLFIVCCIVVGVFLGAAVLTLIAGAA